MSTYLELMALYELLAEEQRSSVVMLPDGYTLKRERDQANGKARLAKTHPAGSIYLYEDSDDIPAWAVEVLGWYKGA